MVKHLITPSCSTSSDNFPRLWIDHIVVINNRGINNKHIIQSLPHILYVTCVHEVNQSLNIMHHAEFTNGCGRVSIKVGCTHYYGSSSMHVVHFLRRYDNTISATNTKKPLPWVLFITNFPVLRDQIYIHPNHVSRPRHITHLVGSISSVLLICEPKVTPVIKLS